MRLSHVWRLVPVTALALAIAAPASADVTIKSKMTMQAMGQTMASESTLMIKDGFMRTDMSVNGMPQTSIIDLNGHRYITLDPRNRTATVMSADAMKAQMEQAGAGDMTMDITPTGDTKTVAGMSCAGYTINVSMPMNMGGQAMTMTMTGPSWSAKDVPGAEDFFAFMKLASEAGMLLVNPGQQGQANAGELMRKMAEAGLPCASELEVGMAGGGEMAAMMSQMGKSSMVNETVSVSTDTLDEALFAIPDGYTVKNP
jgi:hypothetical protein